MPHQSGFKSDSPFKRLLDRKGYTEPATLGIFRNICTRLVREPDKVAPNSPMLPGLAQFLKIPLKTLKEYATAAPMSEAFERKIRMQMANGTIPRGQQVVRHSAKRVSQQELPMQDVEVEVVDGAEGGAETVHQKLSAAASQPRSNSTPFLRMCVERGYTLAALGEKARIPAPMMWRLSSGSMARNHPLLTVIAETLDVPVSDVAQHMKMPEIGGPWLERAHALVASYQDGTNKAMNKRDRRVKAAKAAKAVADDEPDTTPRGQRLAHVSSNGNGANVTMMRGPHNRLGSKRTEIQLRQSARAMVATLNISIMRGDTHMPPLPVGDLYLVLQDYLVEKGVKVNVLVDPNFASVFDPK